MGGAAASACDFLTDRLLDDEDEDARTSATSTPSGSSSTTRTCSVLGAGADGALAGARTCSRPSGDAARRSTHSAPTARGRTRRAQGHGWVDNFHTGYVLEALTPASSSTGRFGRRSSAASTSGSGTSSRRTGRRSTSPTACSRSTRTTTPRRSRPGSPRRPGATGAVERARRCAEQLVRDWLEPDGSHRVPAAPVLDEPRAVRALDDGAGVPRAGAARARARAT